MSLFAVVGCAMPPKTVEEFRKTAVERKGQKTITIDAPLKTVVSRISSHAKQCGNFGIKESRREINGPGGSSFTENWSTRWTKRKNGHPTFLVTMDSKQFINRQEGGFYYHVIDLEPKGSKTVATLYDLNHSFLPEHNKEYSAVVKGQKAICHFKGK